jgi:hypothetical protein
MRSSLVIYNADPSTNEHTTKSSLLNMQSSLDHTALQSLIYNQNQNQDQNQNHPSLTKAVMRQPKRFKRKIIRAPETKPSKTMVGTGSMVPRNTEARLRVNRPKSVQAYTESLIDHEKHKFREL